MLSTYMYFKTYFNVFFTLVTSMQGSVEELPPIPHTGQNDNKLIINCCSCYCFITTTTATAAVPVVLLVGQVTLQL